MPLLPQRWNLKNCDEKKAARLQAELKIHPILCRLLVNRGINTFEDAKKFFRPSLDDLHDPFLMMDMQQAVERVQKAIDSNEKILIYGDYDVDGTTAVSLVYTFMKDNLHDNIDFYIPNRYSEGYGISFQGVDYAKEHGFSLIIALDCGVTAIDKVDYANTLGIDFIICDHHRAGKEIPRAVAVLDPQRHDCNYPYKDLSGAGIGFKLMQALTEVYGLPKEKLYKKLDLAAVSIAADIVPITGENRILAYYGLKQINTGPCKGIKALIEANNLKRELTITDLVFILAPRINAAGRMDDARHAVRLLIAGEDDEMLPEKVETLNTNNSNRKTLDAAITEEALAIIDGSEALKKKKTTVVYGKDWHKGVIGIVASRLMESYYRPTIVLTESANGMMAGSARSVRGFDIHHAIGACSGLIEQYGGHMYAAGLSLKKENLEKFIKKFEETVAATIDASLLTRELPVEAELEFNEINASFFKILKQFAPFGPENMKPVFLTKNVFDDGYSRMVGNNHLKLGLRKGRSARYYGIAFERGEMAEKICRNGNAGNTMDNTAPPAPLIDICYTIEENEWNGKVSLQLNVKDLRVNPTDEAESREPHQALQAQDSR